MPQMDCLESKPKRSDFQIKMFAHAKTMNDSEAKSQGKWLRLSTLGLLYFVQGAPYGFQTACLPLILRQNGLSFTEIGVMKLLFLPWVCKPLYAPLVERWRTRNWWLTASMLALGVTCAVAGFTTSPTQLASLSLLMFILNFFSATQDIATDSLAVRVLEPEELGAGNTVQVVAYKAGSVFAGGLLLWIKDILHWSGMFLVFGSIYFVCVVLMNALGLVRRSSAAFDAKNKARMKASDPNLLKADLSRSSGDVVSDVLSVKGTLFMMAFVLFYKLCERAEQTFTLFMVDKRVPTATLAMWSTVMRTISLLGSTRGGYILSRSSSPASPRSVLVFYTLLRSLPIACQLAIVHSWGPEKVEDPDWVFGGASLLNRDRAFMYAGFACISATLFAAGVITTATFTLMMRLSQRAPESVKGTHYTTLATFEVLGKLAFASVAGGVIDHFGLEHTFVGFVVLAALCVPLALNIPEEGWSTTEKKS